MKFRFVFWDVLPCKIIKESKLSITIRVARLRWAGHLRRVDEEALARRIMYVTPIEQWKTGRPKARWREEVGDKELVVYSYEQRRMEAIFKESQDSYRVVEPMMMMMMTYVKEILYFINYGVFNNAVCSSDCKALNGRMISE
jgi:hypothetical protein